MNPESPKIFVEITKQAIKDVDVAATYQLWEMVLNSPVAIAVASGLAVAIVTLIVPCINNYYNAKSKKLEWERSETKRKEERHFELKRKAYEMLLTILGEAPVLTNEEMEVRILPTVLYIDCYSSTKVQKISRMLIDGIWKAGDKKLTPDERKSALPSDYYTRLNEAMREDLESHFNHIK